MACVPTLLSKLSIWFVVNVVQVVLQITTQMCQRTEVHAARTTRNIFHLSANDGSVVSVVLSYAQCYDIARAGIDQ